MGTGRTGCRARRGLVGAMAPLLAAALVAGCATKRDVSLLHEELLAMQERQDSLAAELRRRDQALMDSVRAHTEMMVRVRGDLGHQLISLEQQLITIQELAGQSDRRLAELRGEFERRVQAILEADADPQGAGMTPGDRARAMGTAEELYEIGVAQLRREATGTARQALEQILEFHAGHELEPDAQYHLAESYAVDQDFERAFREFERVVDDYPDSPRAPAALFRAAVLAEQEGDTRRAREYLERIRAGYPRSDEARLAGEMLPNLPRR